MPLSTLVQSFPWYRYSKKLCAKIDNPRCAGFFTKEESAARGMRLVEGTEGFVEEGNAVRLYWLVDPTDGIIVDAKFQVFGQSVLIGAAEAACELITGKNYDQAKRITADLLDKHLRERSEEHAFPPETFPHVNLVLGAIEIAAQECLDIPVSATYVAPPMPTDIGEVVEGGYPGWDLLDIEQKISVIEQVLDQDVRPYIALDAGGVEVLNLIQGTDVVISYQGSCTSCYSSVGTTLSYIQQILRNKVHPSLVVVPDLSNTQFH